MSFSEAPLSIPRSYQWISDVKGKEWNVILLCRNPLRKLQAVRGTIVPAMLMAATYPCCAHNAPA
jgi:hypothetical protein